MLIHGIQSRLVGANKIVSGYIDDFELWYQIPRQYGSDKFADPFVAAALMVAMKSGETLQVEKSTPVSFKLLQGISQLLDLYSAWYPDLVRISIEAEIAPTGSQQEGYATFFSGGVDSLYTYFQKRELITHLIYIEGIDIQLDNQSLREEVLHSNTKFAEEQGVALIPVASNIRDFCHPRGLSWGSRYSGSGLGSVALLLGFPYTLVPASQSFVSLYPEGTSPLLDHLYSNEVTSIYYDGALPRPVKMRFLATIPGSIDRLRVCWQDNGYNCGKCEKCLRTMLILKMLDLQCPTLPELENLSRLKGWRIESDAQKRIVTSLIEEAERSNKWDIYNFLVRIWRREKMKRWLTEFDRKYCAGVLKSISNKLTGRPE